MHSIKIQYHNTYHKKNTLSITILNTYITKIKIHNII